MKNVRIGLLTICTGALLGGCASHAPLPTVPSVDLQRFMGDWYVIASIPTPLERNIFNAVESYDLAAPDTVQTTFTYRKGSFDGERKVMRPVGYVKDGTGNAVWGMQFIWPFEADYRIAYLDLDYRTTIIGRTKRDYVWIMARDPALEDADYRNLVEVVKELGYDTTELKQVPQRWEITP